MSKFRFTPASLEWIKSKLPYGRVLKLTGSDFEGQNSLKYKFEIQELYMRKYIKLNGKNIFERALKQNQFGLSEAKAYNSLVREIKSAIPIDQYREIVQNKFESFGPAEVLIYLLHDKVYLAGGNDDGDVRIGTKKYEVKAVKYYDKNYVEGFRIGTGVDKVEKDKEEKISKQAVRKNGEEITSNTIITKLVNLQKDKLGINTPQSVKKTTIDKLKSGDGAGEFAKIEKEFQALTVKNYFGKFPFIFVGSKDTGNRMGEIIYYADNIREEDVTIYNYSGKNLKPLIKIRSGGRL